MPIVSAHFRSLLGRNATNVPGSFEDCWNLSSRNAHSFCEFSQTEGAARCGSLGLGLSESCDARQSTIGRHASRERPSVTARIHQCMRSASDSNSPPTLNSCMKVIGVVSGGGGYGGLPPLPPTIDHGQYFFSKWNQHVTLTLYSLYISLTISRFITFVIRQVC